jgi:hypothetical protein
VESFGKKGIDARNSIVRGNTALRMGSTGISATFGSVLVGNTVRESAENGIATYESPSSSALVRQATAVGNGWCGIVVGPSTLLWGGATAANSVAGLRFSSLAGSSSIGSLAVGDATPFSENLGPGQVPSFAGPVACGNCIPFVGGSVCSP